MDSAAAPIGPFRKSSLSNGANNCVEVADAADGGKLVRHSREPEGSRLHFTRGEWSAFVDGVRVGEFD